MTQNKYEVNWESLSNDKLLELFVSDAAKEAEAYDGQIEEILIRRNVINRIEQENENDTE